MLLARLRMFLCSQLKIQIVKRIALTQFCLGARMRPVRKSNSWPMPVNTFVFILETQNIVNSSP